MNLLIKGGRVIDPANNIDKVMDILIEDGTIVERFSNIYTEECINIDAAGKLVLPGFIDMHVHLREPGFEYKEDITSGTRAAAAGGFTTVCCMPNTDPVIDNAAVARFVKERAARSGLVNVLPIGSITKNQEGQELSEMAELIAAGCVAVSDDGRPVLRADIMRNALEYAKMFGLPVLSHCEETSLSQGGQMHEGYYSLIYGLKGIPAEAEEIMVMRDIMLARLTESHIHICHASTRGSMDIIRKAKKEGINVTCEVTPHHLSFTAEIIGTYNTDTKVNPPLRTEDDIEALLEGIEDGTVDCIATDHAPHNQESKDCEYNLAAFGISGIETAVAVVMNLVNEGSIGLERAVELFTVGPAGVLGLQKGALSLGNTADLTIIDPTLVKTVKPDEFYSKGKNTPFKGMRLKGWPYMTIVGGRIVAREGKVLA